MSVDADHVSLTETALRTVADKSPGGDGGVVSSAGVEAVMVAASLTLPAASKATTV